MFKDDSPFFSGVRAVVQKMHSLSSEKLAPYGLNRFEMMVLLKVYEEDGIRQKDIVPGTVGEGISIGIAVKALDKKGYIFRQFDMSDRRVQRVFITKYGLAVKKELMELKSSVEDSIIKGIDRDELLMMEQFFSRMESRLSINDF